MSIFASHFEKIFEIFDTVAEIDGMEEASRTLLKIIGIGYVSGISSDVCREPRCAIISTAFTAVWKNIQRIRNNR